jgi:predicted DNA-binding transcriptional regulator YafY
MKKSCIFIKIFFMPLNKNAWKRYAIIDSLLRNNMKPYPRMVDIIESCRAQDLDPSPETIQKDIAQMKMSRPDGFEAPIQFNRRHLGYEYIDENFSISGIPLTESDKTTIQESIDLIRVIGGTAISSKFNHAMEKVLSVSMEEFLPEYKKQPIIQTMDASSSRGYVHLDLFYKACLHKYPVSFVHYSYSKRMFSSIIAHPFLLKEFENRWYVYAFSEKHQTIRTFGFDRIYDPILLKRKFEQIDRVAHTAYVNDMYGIYPLIEGPKEKIRIKVENMAMNYFAANPIHNSQRLQKTKYGDAEISFELIPTYELLQLFASYGSQLRLLSPLWFRKHLISYLNI